MADTKEKFFGWFGITQQRGIAGWVANSSKPGKSLQVEAYLDGKLVGSAVADEPREQLLERDVATINHGFSMPALSGITPGDERRVFLKITGYPDLRIKPGSFTKTVGAEVQQPKEAEAANSGAARGLEGISAAELLELKVRVRTLEAKNQELLGFLEARKKEVSDLKVTKREMSRANSAAKAAVANATTSLWGGYAEKGRDALIAISMNNGFAAEARASASYELARYYADTGRIHAASRMMARARNASKAFMRGLRPRLLEAHLLCLTKDYEGASARTNEHAELQPDNPNFAISKANIAAALDKNEDRLTALNGMFANAGMARVAVKDWGSPFLSIDVEEQLAPKDGGPKVSVLMSAHNAADYLELAVGSMQKQTWQNLEIIVTDDCSTDNSLEILEAIAARDPRVIILRNSTNKGTYGNRNAMLEVCTGDFVTVHDSDDWSHPQMIEHQIEHLLANPQIRINTTLMCRSSIDLRFALRPSRASLEYCHMNYPGFMMQTKDARELGGWDPIMANADAEFERRAKGAFGKEAFEIINPLAPYSFFLVHDNSLTQSPKMNLRSLTFGSRLEYHKQAEYWLNEKVAGQDENSNKIDAYRMPTRNTKMSPFPVPNSLLIPSQKRADLYFDVLLVSDLTLLGGTRGCNLNYIRAMAGMGLKVGLFHWPRVDLKQVPDISASYRRLNQQGLVEIVTWEDIITAKRVIVHHPPAAVSSLDSFPEVKTDNVAVLVNQLPFQTTEAEITFYKPSSVDHRLKELFNVDKVSWIAISPLSKKYLMKFSADISIANEIWYPPEYRGSEFKPIAAEDRLKRLQSGDPHFVRHARDHWTKWPSNSAEIARDYMVDGKHRFSVLGGTKSVTRTLGTLPERWDTLEYDSVNVDGFLRSGDIYLNFNNSVYIEEFGRNVMEALSHGLPVIAAPVFEESFGAAVLTGNPALEVGRLLDDRSWFMEQVQRGQSFVRENCSLEAVQQRLNQFLQ